MYPERHEHFENPFDNTEHCVFGPQGDGSQGLSGSAQAVEGGLPS